jgi:hypothetical protein
MPREKRPMSVAPLVAYGCKALRTALWSGETPIPNRTSLHVCIFNILEHKRSANHILLYSQDLESLTNTMKAWKKSFKNGKEDQK